VAAVKDAIASDRRPTCQDCTPWSLCALAAATADGWAAEGTMNAWKVLASTGSLPQVVECFAIYYRLGRQAAPAAR
jgi:hypothetical protein